MYLSTKKYKLVSKMEIKGQGVATLQSRQNLYINLACLSVCLYPINVKTAKPIGQIFLRDIT